ncbi:MAG: cytochrome P450 [Polyangiales bacterium]
MSSISIKAPPLAASPWLTRFTESRAYYALQDELAKLFSHAETQRLLAFGLRAVMPNVVLGQFAVVTKHADVVEVLNDPTHFRVSEIYGKRMARTTGAFFLGMDDSATYQRETSYVRSAVEARDLERVRNIAARKAQELIATAAVSGTLEAATGYSHAIALAVVAEYFGVSGPDETTMSRWMRNIFWDLFLNLTDLPSVSQTALRDARELNAYLDQRIQELHAQQVRGDKLPDTFFGRLFAKTLELGFDDITLRRNLAGVIVGAVDTVSKSTVHIIDQLLQRPHELEAARRAALAGDDELVAAYAFEALRFNPHNPIILRHCARSVHVARGTAREALIPAGTTVYASTLSAMFDPSAVEQPHVFRVDRPWQKYLHFGDGMHRCFGERFNRVVIPQAIKALLLRPALARVPGTAGKLHYEGPFPTRMQVII